MRLTVRTSDYTRAGHAAFQRKFSLVAQSILSHPDVFNNLPVPSSELAALAKNLATATGEANNGGSRASKTERNILRERATAMLSKLAANVTFTASFAATREAARGIMTLSGFAINKTEYDKVNLLEQVKMVTGRWTAKPGQALIKWKRIPTGWLHIL